MCSWIIYNCKEYDYFHKKRVKLPQSINESIITHETRTIHKVLSKILLLILLLLCDITTGFIRLSLIFSFVTTLPCRPSLPVHLFDGPISFPLNGPYPSSTPSEGLLVFDPSGTPPRPGVTLYQVPHRCIARTEIWTPVPFLVVDYKQCVLLDVRRFVVCPTL